MLYELPVKQKVSINYSRFNFLAYCMRHEDNNSLLSLYFCIMLMIVRKAMCQEDYPAFYFCPRYLRFNPKYLCLNSNPKRDSNDSTLSYERFPCVSEWIFTLRWSSTARAPERYSSVLCFLIGCSFGNDPVRLRKYSQIRHGLVVITNYSMSMGEKRKIHVMAKRCQRANHTVIAFNPSIFINKRQIQLG